MVAYGDTLRRARRPGWEDAYLDYDSLRSILEQIESLRAGTTNLGAITDESDTRTPAPSGEQRVDSLEDRFLQSLRREIEKVSLFTLTRQGEIAEAVGSLRFAQDALQIHQPSQQQLTHEGDTFEAAIITATVDDSFTSYGDDEPDDLLPRGSIASSPMRTPKRMRRKGVETQAMFRRDVLVRPASTSIDEYTSLGVELLHLLKFVCVNAMGIRKILKKHDKIIFRTGKIMGPSPPGDEEEDEERSISDRLVGGPEDHLQQLANSASVVAIHSSLSTELLDLEHAAENLNKTRIDSTHSYQAAEEGEASSSYPVSLLRFKCTVSSIDTVRQYAQRVNQPFQAFLSSKAMIMTGHDPAGLERATQTALSLLVRFQPDALLVMGKVALKDWERRVVSKTGIPSADDASIGDLDMELDSWGGVDSSSLTINLLSTLLYTVNYYIVAPTANHYAILLGTNGAFGATLVGASSLSAIFAAFLYSLWYTKSSFRSALLFSAFCPCIGNLLYALALSYGSMRFAMWGRILCGFGSAEVVNRQLISACVSFRNMTQASAFFVAAGAIGMSVGPLLAAILDIVSGRDMNVDLRMPFLPSGGIIYNHVTSPGFVMVGLWFLEIVALLVLFREPERINGSNELRQKKDSIVSLDDGAERDGTKYGTSGLEVPQDGSSFKPGLARNNALSQLSLIKHLVFSNMALPVTLLLFGFIELVDEVLISSCSMVCRRYFNWNGSRAGFLIASLGSLVLPAHFVVERASRLYSERKIMKLSVVFICVSLFGTLNYGGLVFDLLGLAAKTLSVSTDDIQSANGTHTVDVTIGGTDIQNVLNEEREVPYDWGYGKFVYILFLSAVFMGTVILEGVVTSIMAKTTPPKLNNTFINSGLLATLVGTLGRVFGDSMITISAFIDQDVFTDFVNAIFFPMIPLAIVGYYLIKRFYTSLR